MGEFFEWFYRLLYVLQKDICYIIEFLQKIINQIGGLTNVNIDGEENEILTYFLNNDVIFHTFLGVTLLGVILLFIFTALASLKVSTGTGNKIKGKGEIVVDSIKGFIQILLVPILLFAFIYLAGGIMKGVMTSLNLSMGGNGREVSIGGRILVVCSQDAYIGEEVDRELIERMFISGTLKYTDVEVVSQFYSFSKMNFFVGVIGPLVLLVLLFKGVLKIIKRILDTIYLYLISPLVGSTYPLDGGQRMNKWREVCVERTLGAYGVILVANICFYILPLISNISFTGSGILDGLIIVLFYIAGGFAISNADLIIGRILGGDGLGREMDLREFMMLARMPMHAGKRIAGKMMSVGTHIIGGKNLANGVKREGQIGYRINKLKATNESRKQKENISKFERAKIKSADALISLIEDGLGGQLKKIKSNKEVIQRHD